MSEGFNNRDPYKKNLFSRKILEWASINLRKFPWRSDRTYYNTFICEFFLQRTRAQQVVPVYERFIRQFPDIQTLLQVERSVLKPYFGELGLLKRLDYLMRIIAFFKETKKDLRDLTDEEFIKLPGIGDYTLAAFKCFARNERVPIVDSNIIRIFQRFFEFRSTKKVQRKDPLIWKLAEELLPETQYDIYNYALIDFGALICKPSNPECHICPLSVECLFFINKRIQKLNKPKTY
ncbi:MAG: hypothetical protein ACTSVL_06160 [Promethearchaeota archaeon]